MKSLSPRIRIAGCLAVFAFLAGCAREPRSPIVEKAEQAGAGNLSAVPTQGMQDWLGNTAT